MRYVWIIPAAQWLIVDMSTMASNATLALVAILGIHAAFNRG